MRGLLVGYGSIGRRHLENFHTLGVRDWAVVHTGAGTLPFEPPCAVRAYSNLADALATETPTFAVAANPTSLHVRTALACVNAGCHVLLEKPVSNGLAGLDELAAAVASSGRSVLVGFQFRFHPALQRIADLLGAEAIGQPLHATATWSEYLPSWHPWEDWREGYAAKRDLGGGVHHTLCHPFDYLRLLFGDALELEASLRTNGPLGLDVAESADVLLSFDRGVTSHVHLDYWGQPAAHHLRITGSHGTIRWDCLTGDLRVWDVAGDAWRVEEFSGGDARNELFLAEAAHFLNVIDGERPRCTLDDGIQIARLCETIEQSARAYTRVQISR